MEKDYKKGPFYETNNLNDFCFIFFLFLHKSRTAKTIFTHFPYSNNVNKFAKLCN